MSQNVKKTKVTSSNRFFYPTNGPKHTDSSFITINDKAIWKAIKKLKWIKWLISYEKKFLSICKSINRVTVTALFSLPRKLEAGAGDVTGTFAANTGWWCSIMWWTVLRSCLIRRAKWALQFVQSTTPSVLRPSNRVRRNDTVRQKCILKRPLLFLTEAAFLNFVVGF